MNINMNVGKKFLQLVRKHFPKNHQLHKIFNTNTIKLSYSCTPNMQSIITQHNSQLLNREEKQQHRSCNCRSKPNCQFSGKCLTPCIVYKAEVIADGEKYAYFRAYEDMFKTRYNNHVKSFKHEKYQNETELSKLIWRLKNDSKPFQLAFSCKCGTRRCDLCFSEKISIIRSEPKGLLNKRTELLSKCRHRNKFIIGNLK